MAEISATEPGDSGSGCEMSSRRTAAPFACEEGREEEPGRKDRPVQEVATCREMARSAAKGASGAEEAPRGNQKLKMGIR